MASSLNRRGLAHMLTRRFGQSPFNAFLQSFGGFSACTLNNMSAAFSRIG